MKKILFKTGAILLLLGALHSCSKDDVVDNSSKNTQDKKYCQQQGTYLQNDQRRGKLLRRMGHQ